MLYPSSPALDIIPRSRDALTADDVARSLGKVSWEASAYARLVYLDDESLRGKLVTALVPRIQKDGYDSGIVKLMLLISLGLDESRGLSRCPQCKGIGQIGSWECENCHGSGLKAPSLRSRAKACQVSHNTFKRSYMYPYMRQVLPTLSDLEVELGRAMAYLKTN